MNWNRDHDYRGIEIDFRQQAVSSGLHQPWIPGEKHRKLSQNIQKFQYQLYFGWEFKQRPLWWCYDEHTDGSRTSTIDHSQFHLLDTARYDRKLAFECFEGHDMVSSMPKNGSKTSHNHPSSENMKLNGFDNEWGLRFQILYLNNQCFEMILGRFHTLSTS